MRLCTRCRIAPLLQILRCQYVPATGSNEAAQRLLDEADVAACFEVAGVAGGRNSLLPGKEGTFAVALGSPLHEAWTAVQNQPFDLFQGPLTRLRVRTRCASHACIVLVGLSPGADSTAHGW